VLSFSFETKIFAAKAGATGRDTSAAANVAAAIVHFIGVRLMGFLSWKFCFVIC
jgi:hypothetical protein